MVNLKTHYNFHAGKNNTLKIGKKFYTHEIKTRGCLKKITNTLFVIN